MNENKKGRIASSNNGSSGDLFFMMMGDFKTLKTLKYCLFMQSLDEK